jgi:fatty acid-binding protein DegV
LQRRLPGLRDLYVREVGAVVGAHVGPGMLAVIVAPYSDNGVE